LQLAPLHRLENGINAVRVFLPKCGSMPKNARAASARSSSTQYDDKLQALRPRPVHDWAPPIRSATSRSPSTAGRRSQASIGASTIRSTALCDGSKEGHRAGTCPHGNAPPWNTDDTQRVLSVQRFRSKGDYHAFEILSHRQRGHRDAGRHDCMGAKRYESKDAWSHYAKDASVEEHRTGSIRICARPSQAQVWLSISIWIHAQP
jgi:hypothetical protein